MKKNEHRKSVVQATALIIGMVALSGCSSSSGSSGGPSGEVNLVAYSASFQESYMEAVVQPFQEKYPDITVNYTAKRGSAEMLSTVQTEKSNPLTDVVIMDTAVAETANEHGLFAKLSEEDIPNLAHVKEEFRNSEGFGPYLMLDAAALVYDTDVITEPPTSWEELWNDDYAGRVNIWAPPSLLGIYLTAISSTLEDEDYTESIEAGVAKLQELAPNVQTFEPNPDEFQHILTGQTVIGIGQNGRGQYYADQSDGRLGVVIPDEGTAYQINTINMVEGAPHSEAAQTFINYALSSEAQSAFAESLYYAPSVDNAEVDPEVQERLVATDGSLNILPMETDFLASVRDAWTERWKKDIITRQ